MKDARRLTNMQLREIVYVDESGIHGRGVFASRRIAEGEYIGTFAGPRRAATASTCCGSMPRTAKIGRSVEAGAIYFDTSTMTGKAMPSSMALTCMPGVSSRAMKKSPSTTGMPSDPCGAVY